MYSFIIYPKSVFQSGICFFKSWINCKSIKYFFHTWQNSEWKTFEVSFHYDSSLFLNNFFFVFLIKKVWILSGAFRINFLNTFMRFVITNKNIFSYFRSYILFLNKKTFAQFYMKSAFIFTSILNIISISKTIRK